MLLAACDTFRAGAVAQLAQWAERAQVDICTPAQDANSLQQGDAMTTTTTTATSPSAVLYSALDKALAEHYDTVLVDTSGRLSNNDALTAELAKMKRVIQKRLSVEKDETTGKPLPNFKVPHETLLVMDAAQGRMALDAAKVWNEEIGLTGLILTKLDGTARGGSVVAISKELKLPVKLIGVGEGIDDLRDVSSKCILLLRSRTMQVVDSRLMKAINYACSQQYSYKFALFFLNQFEPERFVDGLLGIGEAGGSSSSSQDGSVLASRLAEMRKERDARAVAAKHVLKKATNEQAFSMAKTNSNPVAATTSSPDKPSKASTSTKPKSKKNKKGKR